ncbi:unnamed protein product [Rodentolepis nana]|uniref:Ovule protein n=1 Tax=Rodentolepis nana TaxID=102285 RepID=A0A0R3TD20_RODNA|nr:unnamed protein product [Rodentolepis nana]
MLLRQCDAYDSSLSLPIYTHNINIQFITKATTAANTAEQIPNCQQRHLRRRTHMTLQTQHRLHSIAPISTSTPQRAIPRNNLQPHLPLSLYRSLCSHHNVTCQLTTSQLEMTLLKPSSF